jgi:RNA polymerase sigma-70 factor (ECF subfamily)
MNRGDPTRVPTEAKPVLTENEHEGRLLAEIARGNLDRFDTLIDRYKHRVFRFIRIRIGDWHTAQDLSQETFLRLFWAARGNGYDGRASVSTWVFTIARNCTVDYLRARHRRQDRLAPDAAKPGTGIEDQPSGEAGPAEQASQRERLRVVRSLLYGLPPEQREVIELKVWAGLTFPQIAELTGRPVTTVKSQMAYGLIKLAQRMPGREECES